jgi:pimeloyl-ACP methyl ester carboxylesterase
MRSSPAFSLKYGIYPGMMLPALISLLISAPAFAKVLDESANIAGMNLHYKVVLPKDYDPEKSYPAVLAFPPGSQDNSMVQVTLLQNWAGEAQRRGYIVVIPAAPNGHPFPQEGARVFPEFLDKLLHDYKIRDNKFHIAGMSNGGISAFHIAASYPQYFFSATGFPGYLRDATPERMNALAGLCIHMHVGELDTGWRQSMEKQAAEFRAKGFSVQLTVEKDEQHVIVALTGAGAVRLFKELEGTRPGEAQKCAAAH